MSASRCIQTLLIWVTLASAAIGIPPSFAQRAPPAPPGLAQREQDAAKTAADAKLYMQARAAYASALCSGDEARQHAGLVGYLNTHLTLYVDIQKQAADDRDVYAASVDRSSKSDALYKAAKDNIDASGMYQVQLASSKAYDRWQALLNAKVKSITENLEASGVDFTTPSANCPPPTQTSRPEGGPTIPEPPAKPGPPKPSPPPTGPAAPVGPAAPAPPPQDPVKESVDRTHAASDAEAKLREEVLRLSKYGCTLEGLKARQAYDAARATSNAAIAAEVAVSPEVTATQAKFPASDQSDAALDARHDAGVAARRRINEREHFPPLLAPGCPPGAAAPEPAPQPKPAAPDPNSHSSTLGIRLPPKAQPNTRAGGDDEPSAPP